MTTPQHSEESNEALKIDEGDKVDYLNEGTKIVTQADKTHVWIDGERVARDSLIQNFKTGDVERVGSSPLFDAFN